jgi:hypothetical protein
MTTGAEPGAAMPPPDSPQQGAAEPQPPSWAGPQAGWHGAGPASWQPPPREHGERNSMNDGRRQLLPKQLLQPGAAARLATTSARHIARVMTGFSSSDRWGRRAWGSHAASPTTPPEPYLMIAARHADAPIFPAVAARLFHGCR